MDLTLESNGVIALILRTSITKTQLIQCNLAFEHKKKSGITEVTPDEGGEKVKELVFASFEFADAAT
jgi:hypothetical protein